MSSSTSSSVSNATVMKAFTFWYDREVRFNLTDEEGEVQIGCGETLFCALSPVEDTKGNGGEEGIMYVTNLRCIWRNKLHPLKSLSIGYNTVQGMEVREANSRLRGTTEALYVNSRHNSNRYEFLFTCTARNMRFFSIVPAVWRAYDSSRGYRELRMRSAVIRGGDIILLPGEQLFTRLEGVTNVSEDKGVIGTLFTTNVRLVWFAQHAPMVNVSIPLLHLTALRLRPTKFGPAILMETSQYAGRCLLGFRVDPVERLRELFKECASLWKAWTARPILGVAVVVQDSPSREEADETTRNNNNSMKDNNNNNNNNNENDDNRDTFATAPQPRNQGGDDVVQQVASDAFAAYYLDMGQKGGDRRPEYDASIGLAVEKLRTGVTLRGLWTVVT